MEGGLTVMASQSPYGAQSLATAMYAGWKLGRRVRSQSPYGAQSLATDDRAAPHEGWDWSQSPYGAQSLATCVWG